MLATIWNTSGKDALQKAEAMTPDFAPLSAAFLCQQECAEEMYLRGIRNAPPQSGFHYESTGMLEINHAFRV
jgi:hypothetical protein